MCEQKNIRDSDNNLEEKGCFIAINYGNATNICQESITLDIACQWLRNDSGLTEEYLDKIIRVYVIEDSTKCCKIMIDFNRTANCFEALQQIISDKIVAESNKKVHIWNRHNMYCPHGYFVWLVVTTDLSFRLIRENLSKYGEVFEMSYIRSQGVNLKKCPIKVGMLMFSDSDLQNKDPKVLGFHDMEMGFLAATGEKRVNVDFINEVWRTHGSNATAAAQRDRTQIN